MHFFAKLIYGSLVCVFVLQVWCVLIWRSQQPAPDILFLSFPKSGRTWLRWMVGYALAEEALTVGHIANFPSLSELLRGKFAGDDVLRHLRFPSYAFVHNIGGKHPFLSGAEELDHAEASAFVNKSIIMLVRDPRDVVVSSFYEAKHRYAPGKRPTSIDDFICGEVGAYKTIVATYRQWAQSIPSHAKRWLVVKYESLHTNAARELRRVFEFMGLGERVSERSIDAAVAAGRFETMQWIEQRNSHYRAGRPLPPAPDFIPHRIATMQPERIDSFSMYDIDVPDSAKVRSGAIGSHQKIVAEYPRVAALFQELPCNCSFY